ncbi:MAG: hypothetical protein ACTSR8_05210 [Promethearchaeota archaeon]
MLFARELTYLAQLSGMTAAISLTIGFLLGAIVLSKAIKVKQRILYLFFLCIIFTLSPWYPSGFGYVFWLVTGENIYYEAYVIIGTIGIPIAILAWLDVYITTIKPDKKNIVLLLYGIVSIAFEIYLFYFLFAHPGAPVETMLGLFESEENFIDIDYKGFVLVYLALSIVIAVTTGLHFAMTSMKIENNPELNWKGKFLFIAFILFGISATFDAIIPMTPEILVIVRFGLMATTFFFYLGFILPKWMKKILSIEIEE